MSWRRTTESSSSSTSRAAPLLPMASNSSRSLDKMDLGLTPTNVTPSARPPPPPSHLARPRPEIILRWKRFSLLVCLAAVAISALTVTLWVGIPLVDVSPDDAESKVELFNSYSGVIMGFVESGVSLLLGYLFPVFIVYLHNLKWSRQDDPATRPISRTKKLALLLFFPVIMVAIGNSLSAVQTNQSGGDGSSSSRRRLVSVPRPATSLLDETVYRSVVRGVTLPADDHRPTTREFDLDRVVAGTRVAMGLPLREWSGEVATALHEQQQQQQHDDHDDHDVALGRQQLRPRHAVPLATTVDLLLQGLTVFKQHAQSSGGLPVDMTTAPLLALARQPTAVATADTVLAAVRGAFAAVAAVNSSAIGLRAWRRTLQPHVQLELLALALPVVSTQTPVVACGQQTCIAASADPLARLRALVAASSFARGCVDEDVVRCDAERNAAFLYGSTVEAAAARGEHGSVRYTATLTLAKLSWSFDDHALSLCSAATTVDDACAGLSMRLPHSRRHLVVNAHLVPTSRLLHGASNPRTLVQIVQPPVRLADKLGAATLLKRTPSLPASGGASAGVDRLSSLIVGNRLALDAAAMVPTMELTALLFLFQHAVVTPAAASPAVAWERHLVQSAATTKEYQIYVANTQFGAISTWIACGILFFLSSLVLLFPNARARLEPPKGGNARAERFIAVQTEEVYPNLIYKKRFRIGKTGEKIKFREFAVEAVTLHHKMDEDEQIEL